MRRQSSAIGLACLADITVCSLWRAFGGDAWLAAGIALGAALLIVVERDRVPKSFLITGALLLGASLLLLPLAAAPLAATARGVFVGGLLLSLMASVALLGHCALRSRHIHLVGEYLRAQPVGQRYLAFTVASQIFSSMLSLAGANILFGMMPKKSSHDAAHAEEVTAITRGFSAATFWSPMFGNMAILLALYPALHWIDVFPLGLLLAQTTVLVSFLMHRRQLRLAGEATAPAVATLRLDRSFFSPIAALGLFIGWLLAASALFDISVTATIVLSAPIVGWLINILLSSAGRGRLLDGALRLVQDVRNLPSLAPEATVLMAAGCAGTILSSAFPVSWALHIGLALSVAPVVAVTALVSILLVIALVGVHPVLTAVFLASTFTPEQIGLPPVVHFCAILAGWGLAASLTPFSVLSMTASRSSGIGLYEVSFKANWRFVAWCILVFAVVLAAAAELL